MLAHVVDVSIRSLLLVLIAGIVLWGLRGKRTAALEHAAWTAVVCGMLALFVFGSALPRLPLRVLDRPAAAPLRFPPPLRYAPLVGETAELPAPMPPARPRSIDWSSVAVYAYAAIALLFLVRFVTGMFLVRKLLRTSIEVGGFRESATIAVPLTTGVTRSKILLPLEWRDWDCEKLDAVLAHEGAHVRRRDGLIAALAGINRCVFWFHPLAWILERRLRLLAELACDESCIATLGDRERYARLLLDMASVVDGTHGRLQGHALTMAASSHIRQRIDSILKEQRKPSPGLTWTGWAAVALGGIPVVLGAGALELAAPLPPLPPPGWKFTAPAPPPPRLLAQARSTSPSPSPAAIAAPKFEVAAIRLSSACDTGGRSGKGGNSSRIRWSPGSLDVECTTLERLIQQAYLAYGDGQLLPVMANGVQLPRMSVRLMSQPIKGSPAWVNSDRYNIQAKAEGAPSEEMTRGPMMQALLEDRFQLRIHRETREIPIYELTVAKGGPKFKEAQPGSCIADRDRRPPRAGARAATSFRYGNVLRPLHSIPRERWVRRKRNHDGKPRQKLFDNF
jgi:hypothetical protein